MAQPTQILPVEPGPLDDALQEALRVLRLADERGLRLRLLGGLAFQARIPGWDGGSGRAQAARRDIDLATCVADARGIARMLAEAGYEGDSHHNALYGHKQLYFVDRGHERPVDVVVDVLEMCHRLEFADRLTVDHTSLPLADLLLSKLQVVQLTHKDAVDALVLLSRFPLSDSDGESINVARILSLTSTDWGWWRTTTGNLEKLRSLARGEVAAAELAGGAGPRFDPVEQVDRLQGAIESAPKSLRWRLRSQVGERVRWYDEPEEVAHGS